eukprot:5665153-Amphidinium_carterae.1
MTVARISSGLPLKTLTNLLSTGDVEGAHNVINCCFSLTWLLTVAKQADEVCPCCLVLKT